MDLEELAVELAKVQADEKELKERRAEIRPFFIEYFTNHLATEEHRLESDSIEIPRAFWQRTKLTQQEFFETRYPGWIITHHEVKPERSSDVFVLRKDPHFVNDSFTAEVDGRRIVVSRTVDNYAPSIDWISLERDDPDLFSRLAKEVVVYELDVEEFDAIMEKEPALVATLRRHLIVKPPIVKITPKTQEKK